MTFTDKTEVEAVIKLTACAGCTKIGDLYPSGDVVEDTHRPGRFNCPVVCRACGFTGVLSTRKIVGDYPEKNTYTVECR